MQMEFKDKLMENLTDELKKFREHRNRARRNNLELVDNMLSRLTGKYFFIFCRNLKRKVVNSIIAT